MLIGRAIDILADLMQPDIHKKTVANTALNVIGRLI